MSRTWIYHETEEAKIIDIVDREKYFKEGWADSPAQWIKLAALGIDPDKAKSGDIQETQKAQVVLQAVEGVVDNLNGALNLEEMTKNELEAYAREHYDVELDKRKSNKNLIKQVRELTDGDSE